MQESSHATVYCHAWMSAKCTREFGPVQPLPQLVPKSGPGMTDISTYSIGILRILADNTCGTCLMKCEMTSRCLILRIEKSSCTTRR